MNNIKIKKIILIMIPIVIYFLFGLIVSVFFLSTDICLYDTSALCPLNNVSFRNRSMFLVYGVPFALITYYSLLLFLTKKKRNTKLRKESIIFYKKGISYSSASIMVLVVWYLYCLLSKINYNMWISGVFFGIYIVSIICAMNKFDKVKIKM